MHRVIANTRAARLTAIIHTNNISWSDITAIIVDTAPQGEIWTQKLKSHLVRTHSSNILPLKPGVGQYIATHATLTARDFSLAYFYSSGPFTCIFFPKSLLISLVLAMASI